MIPADDEQVLSVRDVLCRKIHRKPVQSLAHETPNKVSTETNVIVTTFADLISIIEDKGSDFTR